MSEHAIKAVISLINDTNSAPFHAISGARSVERGKPGSTAQYIDHLYVRRERPALYPPWQEPPRAGEKRHGCDPVHAKAVGANAHWCSPFQMWTPADPDGKWTTCKAQNFTVQYPY